MACQPRNPSIGVLPHSLPKTMRDRKSRRERFPVDPTVKGKIGGSAPAGHPRRCQGINNFGVQCNQYATIGRRFCRFHGGKSPLLAKQNMGRYAKSVSKPLAEKLRELAGEGPDERADLSDEVDASRLIVERSLKIYDLVVVQGRINKTEDSTPEQKALAINGLRSALDSTASLVEKLARVNNMMKDKVTVDQIGFVVAQIGKALEEEVEDPKIRERVLSKIKSIQIPEDVKLNPRVSLEWD